MKLIELVTLAFAFVEGHFQKVNRHEILFNFTTQKMVGDHEKAEGFIKDKCVLKLIQEAVNQFGSTYMFITDGHYHSHLLHNLQINFVHSYFTEPSHLSHSKSETFDNLLIFGNKFKLKEVITKKKPFQATKFFVLARNYEQVIEKFEILWENRLVNVVASYVENSTVYYYTYFPYRPTHCGRVGEPHLLAQCDISNGVFSHREKLFPRKVCNLHKCPLRVTFTENVPSSYYGKDNKLTGWEVELLNEILERINGVPNYKIWNSKRRIYRTQQGYSRLVMQSEIGGGLLVSLRGLVETDFCMYGMSLCSTWIEPKKEDSPHSFNFLTKVFPPGVWIFVLLAYLVMATVIRTFCKVKYGHILFKLLPFLLGTAIPTKVIPKRLGTLWLWFCLIINAIYQCGFQSTLLVPNSPQQTGSTKEVLDSNLKILGVTDIITDAIPYFKEKFNLSSRRLRNRRLTYEDWVYRMVVKKDSAFLGFKETVRYHVDRTELASQIFIPDNCVIKYLLTFVLKKNSHLTEILTKFSNRLNENGFLEFFIRKHLSRESRQNVPKRLMKIFKPIQDGNQMPPPINMDKIFVLFICLTCGISLGLIALMAELMSKWDWKSIKKRTAEELQSAWTCN